MSELTWKKAIEKVFLEERRALHYTEVAEIIADRVYRTKMGLTLKDPVISKKKAKHIISELFTNKN